MLKLSLVFTDNGPNKTLEGLDRETKTGMVECQIRFVSSV